MVRPALAPVLLGLALLAGGPAAAQTRAPVTASISALSMQPLPAGGTVQVVAYDDSDLARSIANVAGQALEARGYQVADSGQLQLGIELIDGVTVEDWAPIPGSTNLDPAGQDDSDPRVNLFADNEDSVLGGRIEPTSADALQFGIFVTLNDLGSGRRIWQAEIMADITGSDRETAGPLMAQAAIQRLGEPVAQEPMVLE